MVEGLVKRYGPRTALDGIGFTVARGETVGFLGPNGAGKSTTMNILAGCASASGGRVSVGGFDLDEEPEQARRITGYLPEKPPLYDDMTVGEYLDFVARLRKVAPARRRARCDETIGLASLGEVRGRLVRNLSKGFRQRLGLAQALVADPEVLILDEPTSGLDPKQIHEIRNLVVSLGSDRTILLSSHILQEVSAVCPRIVILDRGRIVMDGTTEEVSARLQGGSRILVRFAATEAESERTLRRLDPPDAGPPTFRRLGDAEAGAVDYLVESAAGSDLRRELFRVCAASGTTILEMRRDTLSLEDVFLRLTDHGREDD